MGAEIGKIRYQGLGGRIGDGQSSMHGQPMPAFPFIGMGDGQEGEQDIIIFYKGGKGQIPPAGGIDGKMSVDSPFGIAGGTGGVDYCHAVIQFHTAPPVFKSKTVFKDGFTAQFPQGF